jgi:hypothetical protein
LWPKGKSLFRGSGVGWAAVDERTFLVQNEQLRAAERRTNLGLDVDLVIRL